MPPTAVAAIIMLREVQCYSKPEEVFCSLVERAGLVFLDSANSQAGISILACEPQQRLAGEDWSQLEDFYSRFATSGGDREVSGSMMPDGALIGAVEYTGAFDFALYKDLLVYQHATNRWYAAGRGDRWLSVKPGGGNALVLEGREFSRDMTQEEFLAMVNRAQDYIAAGDIYQVNLAQRLTACSMPHPAALYQRLRQVSPAPYGAYLDLGERQILSSSPELFLSIGGRQILTRPIKGTRRRYRDQRRDLQAARELLASPKERAELLMITDLERNDLGKICAIGSIQVPELLVLESFEQVHHMVSTVSGCLRPGISHVQALLECSPGGSISGAPKSRARQIIAELELTPRGLYTGAIGYLGLNGYSQFNIAIRTLINEQQLMHFHVGAGIVADSVPELEYQETLDKAAGIFAACEGTGHRK